MDDDRPSPTSVDAESSTYAQALRFLISLQSQKNQDTDAQRNFLRGKGLSDELIDRALSESKRPEVMAKDGLVAASSSADVSDADAFDRAAQMFDDPLHAASADSALSTQAFSPSLPARTYPRSPLALYGAQQGNGSGSEQLVSSVDNPLTRYHVLLRFFRSLCYYLVLGGGFASIAVALYRAYMMPRLMATLDARSDLLKHHRGIYSQLAEQVRRLRGESLAPAEAVEAALSRSKASGTPTAVLKKGVLKKVQFADEIQEGKGEVDDVKTTNLDEEDKKQAGDDADAEAFVTDEKTALLSKNGAEEAAKGSTDSSDGKEEQSKALPPIDILESLHDGLRRLKEALQTEVSGPTADAATGAGVAKATSVEDESDVESWISDDDGSEELEFDPFAPPSIGKSSSQKRKHAPKGDRESTNKGSHSASSTSATTLKASLNTINAYINTQTYMANANVFKTRSLGYGGLGSLGAGGNDQAAAGNKPGDVAQVRAEIRSLKGLLLSRRNFPIYSRPTAPRIESST